MLKLHEELEKTALELETKLLAARERLNIYVAAAEVEMQSLQSIIEKLRSEAETLRLASTAAAIEDEIAASLVEQSMKKPKMADRIREQAYARLSANNGRMSVSRLVAILSAMGFGSNDPSQLVRKTLARDRNLRLEDGDYIFVAGV